MTDFPRDDNGGNFILTRHIGLKEAIPGSGQWCMITDKDDTCWHCDQWVYTLIFWNKERIGENARTKTNPAVCAKLVKEVTKINPDFMKMIAESRASSMASLEPYSSTSGQESKEELRQPQVEFEL